ncbi:hypothetical protein LTR53_008291 [Teratosphaeriaceae sp. CCFEE 6253]|nr:hypothetical protein LTR53_008291 [Teratosphaeriaceae sp. CCFEE 6253]
MKCTTLSCLLTALCAASNVLAHAVREPAAAAITASPIATPAPELGEAEARPHLDPRQGAVVVDPAATINPQQYPIATTQWFQSTILSSTTYISVVYTQTFENVPDQLPTAAKGSIGYGTLTKHGKRQEPMETGYAQVVVLEIHNEVVTQYVQPVTEVLILHTIAMMPNATEAGNYTYPGINGTYINGTSTNSTMNGTAYHTTSAAAPSGALGYDSSTGTGAAFYLP